MYKKRQHPQRAAFSGSAVARRRSHEEKHKRDPIEQEEKEEKGERQAWVQ